MTGSRSRSGAGSAPARLPRSIARSLPELRAVGRDAAGPDLRRPARAAARRAHDRGPLARTRQHARRYGRRAAEGAHRGDRRSARAPGAVRHPVVLRGVAGDARKLDALPVDVLFPGHGPVLRDRTYLRQVQGLLRALVDRVKAAVAAGATLEETAEAGHARRIGRRRWPGTIRAKQRAFDEFFVQPAVERTWRQLRGEPDK